MMISKLAKASNTQNISPTSARQTGSGSKRVTLDIFSQFRKAEDLNEQSRATEDEIEAMLDQNLFRENPETPTHASIKQFQIVSDCANHLLDDEPDFPTAKVPTSDIRFTPSSIFGQGEKSPQTKSTAFTENLSPGQHGFYGGFFNKDHSSHQSTKNATTVSNGTTSMFTLQVPTDEVADRQAQGVTPKLNAQNLFAFGADTFSSAFSEAKCLADNQDQRVNPWALSGAEQNAQSQRQEFSGFKQHANIVPPQSAETVHPFWPTSQATNNLLNSSDSDNSSLTEEIFAGSIGADALGKKAFSRQGSNSSINGSGTFQQESTKSELSFGSFTANSGNGSSFCPTGPGMFTKEVSCNAPIFKPSNYQSMNVFYPTQAPMQNFQMQQNQQMAPVAFNSYNMPSYQNTQGFQGQNRQAKPADVHQKARPSSDKIVLALPQHLQALLSEDEFQIIMKVQELAFDQAGCRMIQKKLEGDVADKIRIGNFATSLVHVMLNIFPDVMVNQFGNYLCQKLIEVCPVPALKQLVQAVLPSLVQVSMDLHGTRVIQTLVESLAIDTAALHNEILAIGALMSEYIFDLSTHSNGNHVIQAFLLTFKASDKPEQADQPGSEALEVYTRFIYRACMAYCDQIGSDKHGCCVMQRCLEKGLTSQKLALADVIISRIHFLIEDPYGNYLVQNVLKLKNEVRNEQILNFIAGDFVRLSQLKFSSNVIEKCLETKCAANQVDQILKGTHYWDDQVLVRELGNQSRCRELRVNQIVSKLATHQFGNYVLQRAIAIIADSELQMQVLESIQLLSGSLAQSKHGQKVLTKLQKAYPHMFVGASIVGNTRNVASAGQQKKKSANRKGQNARNTTTKKSQQCKQ